MTKKFLLIFLAAFLLIGLGFSSAMAQADDLAVDFGSLGLWAYDGASTWTELNAYNPALMVEQNGDLLVAFDVGGASGLYRYHETNVTTWRWDPKNMIEAGSNVFIDYGAPTEEEERGLWKYWRDGDGTHWEPTAANPDPDKMIARSSNVLFLHYLRDGLYKYNHNTKNFIKLGTWDPENIITDGTNVFLDYGTKGLWKYAGSFIKLGPWDPEDMIVVGSYVFLDYGTKGLWKYDGDFSKLGSWDPEDMIAIGSVAILDYGTNGLWKFDGSWPFTKIGYGDAQVMAEFNGDLIAAFGLHEWYPRIHEYLYKYDLSTSKWSAISKPIDRPRGITRYVPDDMVDGVDLF